MTPAAQDELLAALKMVEDYLRCSNYATDFSAEELQIVQKAIARSEQHLTAARRHKIARRVDTMKKLLIGLGGVVVLSQVF